MSEPRAAPLPLGDVLEFVRLVWAIAHGLQSTSKRMELDLGVTGPQRLVLRLVGRFPGVTAGQLAEVLHVHPSTVTGILARLDRRGLIARRVDPRDRRRAFLGLTPAGRALDIETPGTAEAALQEALREVPPARLAIAHEVLAAIAGQLERSGRLAPGRALAGGEPRRRRRPISPSTEAP